MQGSRRTRSGAAPSGLAVLLTALGLVHVGNQVAVATGPCPAPGDCFVPHGTPGCDDAKCCSAVCAIDPFCCDTAWDEICVDEANQLCVGGDCGPSCNKLNVECLVGNPEYDNRRPVGQLVQGGSAFCTAWIVAAPNIVMTNQHCTAGSIAGYSARFNAECDACEGGAMKTTDSYAAVELLYENAALDFALIRLEGNPAAVWGVATVDDADPVVGQPIYEIHHGEGLAKGYDSGIITSVDIPGTCIPGTLAEISVSAVATGGASGSPIFNTITQCVTAICHCGPPCAPGWGVPMSFIWPDALPHILAAGGVPSSCFKEPPCPWDCDGSDDGVVGIDDFLTVLAQWNQAGTSCHFAGGATIGINEFLAILANWGDCE